MQTRKKNMRSKMKKIKLYGHNNNNYLDEDVPIMCFDPRKITFFMIFFKFTQNPVGNLIFCITSLTTLLLCSVNIHGIEFILIWSPLLWNWMMSFIAWLDSWMSLQILTIFSFSLLPSNIHHNVSATFFLIWIVSNIWAICWCS